MGHRQRARYDRIAVNALGRAQLFQPFDYASAADQRERARRALGCSPVLSLLATAGCHAGSALKPPMVCHSISGDCCELGFHPDLCHGVSPVGRTGVAGARATSLTALCSRRQAPAGPLRLITFRGARASARNGPDRSHRRGRLPAAAARLRSGSRRSRHQGGPGEPARGVGERAVQARQPRYVAQLSTGW